MNSYQLLKTDPINYYSLPITFNPAQSEYLRENNIPFFDSAGNAFINHSGTYIFVSGKKSENISKERPSRLFNKSGLKILFALLVDENLINEDFRTISKLSGVSSISTVSDTFNDLEKSNFLVRRNKSAGGKHRLLNKESLVKRWAIAYGERLRPTLEPIRFSSKKHHNIRWWQSVELGDYEPGARWGGEEGGAILSKHLKPETVTIYADSRLPKLQAEHGLQRDARGNCEIKLNFLNPGSYRLSQLRESHIDHFNFCFLTKRWILHLKHHLRFNYFKNMKTFHLNSLFLLLKRFSQF